MGGDYSLMLRPLLPGGVCERSKKVLPGAFDPNVANVRFERWVSFFVPAAATQKGIKRSCRLTRRRPLVCFSKQKYKKEKKERRWLIV